MITFPRLGQSGRLGNQLWQIAGTIGIAHKEGDDFCFPRWDYEDYFRVPNSWFTNDPIGEDAAEYATHLYPQERVYLQDYSLWRDISETIVSAFQPSPKALIEVHRHFEYFTLPHPLLVMHVRRGDNATAHLRGEEGYHPLRPSSYYRQALSMFQYESIAIFSDDIPWCRQEFADLNAYFFEGGAPRPKEHEPEYHTAPVEDWIDFVAMQEADIFVMSNSTYSWWAAYLSRAPGTRIVYPWPFFGPKLSYIDASRMFPEDWVKLQHAT